MLVSVPSDQEITINLSTKLRGLPTLIDVYILIVDQVLRKHGFDTDRCEFLADQALPPTRLLEEGMTSSHSACCLQASRIGPISSRADRWSQLSESSISCEEEDLLAVAG